MTSAARAAAFSLRVAHAALHLPSKQQPLCVPHPRQAHEAATGPVHAVLSENTAVYHFWSTDTQRWQMGSVELFDASPSTLQ